MRQMKDNGHRFEHYFVVTDFNDARDELIAAKLPNTAPTTLPKTEVKKRPANAAKPKDESKKRKTCSGEKPDEPGTTYEAQAEPEEPEAEEEAESEAPGSSGENPESQAQTNNASSSDDWKQRAMEDMKEFPFEAWGNEKRFEHWAPDLSHLM